jgi:hypothetical protein
VCKTHHSIIARKTKAMTIYKDTIAKRKREKNEHESTHTRLLDSRATVQGPVSHLQFGQF